MTDPTNAPHGELQDGNVGGPSHSELNDGVPMEDPKETDPVNEREAAVQTRREDLNPSEIDGPAAEHTPEESDS
jgi:hypothetical protein